MLRLQRLGDRSNFSYLEPNTPRPGEVRLLFGTLNSESESPNS